MLNQEQNQLEAAGERPEDSGKQCWTHTLLFIANTISAPPALSCLASEALIGAKLARQTRRENAKGRASGGVEAHLCLESKPSRHIFSPTMETAITRRRSLSCRGRWTGQNIGN
jgi:hypothetical protein